MRGLKTLLSTAALFTAVALAPSAKAQIVVGIGVQPCCAWGYYDYAPYGCAPEGFYGSGYFYNGIFLGVGPWAGWGYGHGWGDHRFSGGGGGRYNGGGGEAANRAYATGHGVPTVKTEAVTKQLAATAVVALRFRTAKVTPRPTTLHPTPHLEQGQRITQHPARRLA